ncbi:MAG: hypothetical protein GWN16_01375, partial [Calditrichae bacterium]|nr:hypothetical protein [Calditrichia bacterium]NIW78175.1 hypothetical protein [Calditrichia bacterium]
MFQKTLRMLIIALLAFFIACSNHVHQEEGHGHEHGSTSVTQWNDKTEIFMEYPALVTGEEATFIIHLSKMTDFKPVTEGTLTCIFQDDSGERLEVTENAPSRPGIFLPAVTFSKAGQYEMELRLTSPQVLDTILVSGVQVYSDEAALPHVEEEGDDSYIFFLKEQQWKIDFRTEAAQTRRLSGSIEAVGELLPKPQSHAEVPAPANGLILADQNALIP